MLDRTDMLRRFDAIYTKIGGHHRQFQSTAITSHLVLWTHIRRGPKAFKGGNLDGFSLDGVINVTNT
jgi:hypothetical protein